MPTWRYYILQYGVVKHWDASKGYGFITMEDDTDLFVHQSDLDVTLSGSAMVPGLKVKFDIKSDMKGDKAIRVRKA
jgi:CspA family cold shock protein